MAKYEGQVVYEPAGPSGNIFAIIGGVKRAMRKAGASGREIDAVMETVYSADSYEAALAILDAEVELIAV